MVVGKIADNRPRRAPIWLRALLGLIVVMNAITIVGALNNLQLASALPELPVSPVVQLCGALVAFILFAGLLIGCQWRIPLAYRAVAPLLTAYALWGLNWNAWLTRSTYSQATLGCDVILTLIILAPVWWTARRNGWSKPFPR